VTPSRLKANVVLFQRAVSVTTDPAAVMLLCCSEKGYSAYDLSNMCVALQWRAHRVELAVVNAAFEADGAP
jgi:hypothetical protein